LPPVVVDASGTATVTYAGAKPGVDTIVATAKVGNIAVRSNPGTVTWASRTTPPTPVPTATPRTPGGPTTQPTPVVLTPQPTAVVPATQPTAVVPTKPHKPGSLQCSVPLKTQAAKSLVGGGTLLVRTHSAASARHTMSLKLLTQRVVFRGSGKHRQRIVQVVVKVLATWQGAANRAGTLVARLHVAYKPAKPVRALLTITARRACGAATRTAWVTLLPPHPAKAAHPAKATHPAKAQQPHAPRTSR
jgi:hypothetical protein